MQKSNLKVVSLLRRLKWICFVLCMSPLLTGCVFKRNELVDDRVLRIVLLSTEEVEPYITSYELAISYRMGVTGGSLRYPVQRIGDEALIQILGPPEGAEFEMAIQGTDGEELYERRLGSYRVKDKPQVQTVTYAVGSFTK